MTPRTDGLVRTRDGDLVPAASTAAGPRRRPADARADAPARPLPTGVVASSSRFAPTIAHDDGTTCRGGWIGEDEQGRPRPCSSCRRHLLEREDQGPVGDLPDPAPRARSLPTPGSFLDPPRARGAPAARVQVRTPAPQLAERGTVPRSTPTISTEETTMTTPTIPSTSTSTTAAWPAGLSPTDLPVIAEHLAARAAGIREAAIAEAVDATRDQLGSDPRTRALHAARGLAQAADLDRIAALLTAPAEAPGAAA